MTFFSSFSSSTTASRNSQRVIPWLTGIILLVSLPLIDILPYAIIIIITACCLWHFSSLAKRVHPENKTRRPLPSWIKGAVVIISAISTVHHFQQPAGLDTAATILVTACALKLLEINTVRDVWIILLISFFVAVTGLLYSQSLLLTCYVLVVLTIIVSAMASLQLNENNLALSCKLGLTLSLQALPFMLVLFVLVPRIPPLWSIPSTDPNGVTGLSDSITPGDIARLSQSDALVFRATFNDQPPPPHQRYWRSVVMSQFDGRSWSQLKHQAVSAGAGIAMDTLVQWHPASLQLTPETTPAYQYDIIQEASGQPWLFSLGPAYQSVQRAGITYDHRLVAKEPVNLRKGYRQTTYKEQQKQDALPRWQTQLYLQLPDAGDPRTRNFAQALASKYNNNPQRIANELLALFREDSFFYTLKPPLLGENTIDEFLFKTRRGFCSHYAGAFVFVMRAAGIPARLIAGYQGGELKEKEHMIQVRQFDAHAWAEIWVADQGWIRVDPTHAVSPERIEQGLETAVANEGTFLLNRPLSPIHLRNIELLNQIRLSWEHIEYQWQRYVLQYHEERQQSLFKNLFEDLDFYTTLAVLLGSVISFLLFILCCVLLWPKKMKLSEVDRLYQKFCRKMAKRGLPRHPGESPTQYGHRISTTQPALEKATHHITRIYIELTYGNHGKNRKFLSNRLKKWVDRYV